MKVEYHLKQTGGAGENIHRFLDQFYRYYGPDHRVILHHLKGIHLIGMLYGHEALIIAEIHVRGDWNGKLPYNQHDTNFYRAPWAYDLKTFWEAWAFANEYFDCFNILA